MKVPANETTPSKTNVDEKDKRKLGDNNLNRLNNREYYNIPQSNFWDGHTRNIPPDHPDVEWDCYRIGLKKTDEQKIK